ncbi:MAG TPA: endonuclease/exonuclease/phosphatase family protein [Planctomycetota bacterium]|nr:endonuclease/exonuclease/phosphatase family protein [Planctomycetota bacterium]
MRRFALLLATVAFAATVCGCQIARRPEVPTGPSIRIMTWNVHWAMPQPDLAVEVIKASNADIVCLQETTLEWEIYLRRRLADFYPVLEFRHDEKRLGGGLAILSRLPAIDVAYVASDTGWYDGWVMAFATPVGAVQVNNVHLQPAENELGRFTAASYLAARNSHPHEIERNYRYLLPSLPALVIGDFNEDDDGSAVEWLEAKGMTNALPEFDRHSPTWRWLVGPFVIHHRLDHVVYAGLYCFGAQVLNAGGSDHLPVIADFGRPRARRR